MKLKNVTIDEMIAINAKKYPDGLAFEYEDYSLTWLEVDRITDYLASMYLDIGVRKGTHVGIFSINSPNWISTYIALAKIGAISVLINFNYKEQQLYEIVKYTSLEYLCYGDGYKDQDFNQMIEYLREQKIWKMRKYIPIGRFNHGEWYQVSSIPFQCKNTYKELIEYKKQVMTTDVISMILTSGTIAEPKGVLLTHFQMLNIARESSEKMHWNQTDKICLSLALFHCFGLSTGLLASIMTGSSICLLPSFRSKQVLEAIQKNKCTVINGVPSMFLAILENPNLKQYDLSSLKSGIVAGSGIRKQDYTKIIKLLGIQYLQQSYGQTEASPSITFSGYEDSVELKAISVGRVINHVELRIVNEHSNTELKPLEDGEIQVKGYNTMSYGYYKKKSVTRSAFTPDGWLKTGDLGHVDIEGNLYVTGRIKDVIIRCGENISPKEIEEVMLDYPDIIDVKVFGIPADIVQEEIVACIIHTTSFIEDKFQLYLKQKISDYKIPKYIIEFQNFPLNSNGKLNMNEIRETVVQGIIRRKKNEVYRTT